jgi:high frequency lysogenization protein
MNTDQDRIIALAGIFQAAYLTQQVAHKGMADSSAMDASIHSLFQIDAESVGSVYGGAKNIRTGLQALNREIATINLQGSEVTQYVLTLMHLEQKLSKNSAMMQQIADTMTLATQRLDHFPMLHSNIIALLADTYSSTISTLQPRIMVNEQACPFRTLSVVKSPAFVGDFHFRKLQQQTLFGKHPQSIMFAIFFIIFMLPHV